MIREARIKKKAAKIAIVVAVVALVAVSIRVILAFALIMGITFFDVVKPYDNLSGIENYDKGKLLTEYGSDLDSGLFIFPDETDNTLTVEYESSLKTGLFDTDGSIFLTATYSEGDFDKEVERLSNISCTVFETAYEDSDYHTEKIRYDEETYNYPAYVSVDGYSHVYEYALIDKDAHRIIYVLLSYPDDVTNGVRLLGSADYLKKDKLAYKSNMESTLDRFSIYSFSFSEDMWCEYDPADKGRPLLGNPVF